MPRGRNTLHEVFERHFADFLSRYDEEYADTFGKFRLERIRTVGEHFLTCVDYRKDIAVYATGIPTGNMSISAPWRR